MMDLDFSSWERDSDQGDHSRESRYRPAAERGSIQRLNPSDTADFAHGRVQQIRRSVCERSPPESPCDRLSGIDVTFSFLVRPVLTCVTQRLPRTILHAATVVLTNAAPRHDNADTTCSQPNRDDDASNAASVSHGDARDEPRSPRLRHQAVSDAHRYAEPTNVHGVRLRPRCRSGGPIWCAHWRLIPSAFATGIPSSRTRRMSRQRPERQPDITVRHEDL